MSGDGCTSAISEWQNQIHQGDVLDTLEEMPESSVHMAMTSPPYYGLRDYGEEGQIGLEESLEEYIDKLVSVGDAVRRVLRDDGSWWLNLGDSFAGSWGAQSKDATENNLPQHDQPAKNPARNGQLRRKSKMLVPHRVAIALQDAGWIVRSDAVWSKPNPMPHPVKDRLNEHKEFVFHLTPEPDYWYDLDSVREPHKTESLERNDYAFHTAGSGSSNSPVESRPPEEIAINADDACHPNGKNPGDILEVPVRAFPEAHFAVYPPELCETPIKSSCPPTVCSGCGTPYERETSKVPVWEQELSTIERTQLKRALELYEESELTEDHLHAIRAAGFSDAWHGDETQNGVNSDETKKLAAEAKDVLGGYFREFTSSHETADGWRQVCDCETTETEPGIVLDPFAGAGTTCLVGKELGRRFVGIELNPEYVAMAQKRVGVTVSEPERLLGDGETALTAYTDGGDDT